MEPAIITDVLGAVSGISWPLKSVLGQEVERLPGLQVPDQFGYQFGASEHRPPPSRPGALPHPAPAAAGRGETPRFGNQPESRQK